MHFIFEEQILPWCKHVLLYCYWVPCQVQYIWNWKGTQKNCGNIILTFHLLSTQQGRLYYCIILHYLWTPDMSNTSTLYIHVFFFYPVISLQPHPPVPCLYQQDSKLTQSFSCIMDPLLSVLAAVCHILFILQRKPHIAEVIWHFGELGSFELAGVQ